MAKKNKASHPTEKIWDAVVSIAENGSMQGKIGVYSSGHIGSMRFDTSDGRRFRVTVERVKEHDDD